MGRSFSLPIWLTLWVFLLAQVAGLTPVHAFSLLGFGEFTDSARWSDASLEEGLTFAIAPNFLARSSRDASAAVENAFGTWSAASSALSFTDSGFGQFGPFTGANIDVFAVPPAFRYGGTSLDGALAIALVGIYQGEILGADIFFNKDFAWSDNPGAGEFDIESVALHEIGHALGLDHPDIADDFGLNFDSSGASIMATGLEVMNSTIAPGEISRVLTSDDLAGLGFLYPLSELGSGGQITTANLEPPSVPEPSTFLLFGSGLLALLSLTRRRLAKGSAET